MHFSWRVFGFCIIYSSHLFANSLVPHQTPASRSWDSSYQIGSEWGKHSLKLHEIDELPALRSIALGTGQLQGGTAFYLGKFARHHLIATNHHVCPAGFNCLGKTFYLPLVQRSFKVSQFISTWEEIDLTVLALEVEANSEAVLVEAASPFDFQARIYPGQPLLTVGFGGANNPMRTLVAAYDEDCRVFSEEGDLRLLADPDALHPSETPTWSFANGCDISHGDSGSAIVERETGRVLGLVWTGKMPKPELIQDTAYLRELLRRNGPEIWTELSYAVPASKMRSFIIESAEDMTVTPDRREVLRALSEGSPSPAS